MFKFKKGDEVKITAGKDKGKTGKIEQVMPKKSAVLVPGVNIYKKHVKAQLTADGKGGVYELSRPLTLGKIALICPNCKKITRVGVKIVDGKKVRICRKCGKTI
ncbi:MAG TPA: 50S ribosomal protein L24 [Patescibacteria group bacterium]|nr:50S ribosomal protein L24 [Patescibacteria group bacterium]